MHAIYTMVALIFSDLVAYGARQLTAPVRNALCSAVLPAPSTSVWQSIPAGLISSAVSILSPLIPVFDGLLLAVPKKRRSAYKNRHRRAINGKVEPLKNIRRCHVCNSPMLSHHVCPVCYREAQHEVKKSRHDMQ